MDGLQPLLKSLESGEVSLSDCLSSHPEMPSDQQLVLVLADQRVRLARGLPADVSYYGKVLPWLAADSGSRRKLVLAEFERRLGSAPSSKLQQQFLDRYREEDLHLDEGLEALCYRWNEQPMDDDAFDLLCDQFEEELQAGNAPKIGEWLERVPEASRDRALKELLLVEMHYLEQQGKAVPWEEYRSQFPADKNTIDELKKRLAPKRDTEHGVSQNSILGSPLDLLFPIGSLIENRFRLDRHLGHGAFGAVFLAHDLHLKRQVAIKVPRSRVVWDMTRLQAYQQEAQTIALLNHPNILKVFDIGQLSFGGFFIVMQFVDGGTLKEWSAADGSDFTRVAMILRKVAEGLHHAHEKRLVHRDIKPANILIEAETDHPFIADFGMAVREEDYFQDGGIAGTPAYMSPEQAIGAGHRLDGRSDLYSLGAVMYEMLTGTRLIPTNKFDDVVERITSVAPEPPRIVRPSVPEELERICLKLLQKNPSNRYQSGEELAEDLRAWLSDQSKPSATNRTLSITPRGLRSFTADDAGFFIDLLPGVRNRDGLPQSIAFWKEKIEERDSQRTFQVGLLYGPSGCGKSSLVKAGLIPHLSSNVIPIYLEATPDETEEQLLRLLRSRVSDFPTGTSLPEGLQKLRRLPSRKVVVFLDQVEQWLNGRNDLRNQTLVQALWQCDGGSVQAVLMIRDDFAMAAARMMDAVDVPIVQGGNFATVDLFDEEHGRKVLYKFGQAFGRIPEDLSQCSSEQKAFVNLAVAGLAREGRIVSVRLALFAEMVKQKPWVPATLAEVGGTEGVGESFLRESFESRSANPRHRQHSKAAKEVLQALLPDSGADIKGQMKAEEQLQSACDYQHKPNDFRTLVQILDSELRLITPTDPEEVDSSYSIEGKKKFYQLTHDYLVPSLRRWINLIDLSSREGRARITLADRAASWNVKQEIKQLPTLIEWLQIRRFTEPTKWKAGEKSVMREADRYHITRTLIATTFALGLVLAGLGIKLWNDQRLIDRDASNIVRTIEAADFAKLADELKKLPAIRDVVDPKLKAALELTKPDSEERLKFSLALLPSDPGQVDFLVKKLQSAQASQVQLIIDQLRPHREKILESLWLAIEGDNKSSWLPAASALADYDPKNQRWLGVTAKVTDSMVRDPLRTSKWIELLRPAATQLNPDLIRIYNATPDILRSQAQIDLATEILQMYAADNFSLLHELILSGESGQFAKLFDEYEVFREQAVTQLRIDVAKEFVADSKESSEEVEQSRLQWIARQANAAVALMRLEDTQPVYQFLTVDKDPEALSQFIYRIRGREVSPSLLVKSFRDLARVSTSSDTLERRRNNLKLYGFILGLGEFTVDQLPAYERDGFIAELKALYGDHPSRAVHSALSWLLRRWGQQEYVKAIDETRLEYDPKGVREWYVVQVNPTISEKSGDESSESGEGDNQLPDISAPIYFTMLVFQGGSFEKGEELEAATVDIKGPIAVSDREVTWRQFSPFDGDAHRLSWEKQFQEELGGRILRPEEPAFGVSWFEAVAYCRWLTEELMPGEEKQSYAKKDWTTEQAPTPGWLEIPDPKDWEWQLDLTRPGFRLLTETEWEYVARGGTETEYSFGKNPELLSEYAWCRENSGGWSHPVAGLRPSVAGLFDIHGSMWEWTDDWLGKGSIRVCRGGSWSDDAASCRSAYRNGDVPTLRTNGNGFRLALSLPSGVSSPAEQGVEKGAETARADTEGANAEPRPEMP